MNASWDNDEPDVPGGARAGQGDRDERSSLAALVLGERRPSGARPRRTASGGTNLYARPLDVVVGYRRPSGTEGPYLTLILGFMQDAGYKLRRMSHPKLFGK